MSLRRTSSLSCLLAIFWLLLSSFTFLPAAQCWSFSASADLQSSSIIRAHAFTSVQEAINEAENGSVVFVPVGVYYERVVVNKSISLIGENVSTTVIDGSNAGTVVAVTADDVSISGFTIRNSGWGWTRNGIYVHRANHCEIKNNLLIHNCHNIRLNYSYGSLVIGNTINGDGYGIRLIHSTSCVAANNNVSNCIGGVHLEYATNCTVERNSFAENSQGIRLYSPCTYNKVLENNVCNNTYDGMIEAMPQNTTLFGNAIFHNNFINNTYPFIYKVSGTTWDDGYPSGGNYWSRHNNTDQKRGPYQNETGPDGIADTQYAVNAYDKDRYPLTRPYRSVRNLETGLTYQTIQSAINAPETLNGHTILAETGLYFEHVVVNKTLSLIGKNPTSTFIDGGNSGTVLTIVANNVSITGFTVRNSGVNSPPYGNDCGILLDHTAGCAITDCQVTNNRIGIYIYFSQFNIIEHNVVYANHKDGIWLWFSGNNVLRDNEISDNQYNFGVFGGSFSDFNNSIDTTNSVDGKKIHYLIGAKDQVFNQEDIGVLYLINCSNVTVRDLRLTRNGHGVFCYNVTSSTIINVTTVDNNYGIYLQSSSENIVRNSRSISDWVGTCLQDSNRNLVEGNTASDCEKGFSLYKANHNNLTDNRLLDNLYGIRLFSSSSNKIFHNNFINNSQQADLISSYQNVWDNGCEGNYWSNYNGTDLDGDGIGDTELLWENVDPYPLMSPFIEGDVNHDGRVNILDVVRVASSFGTTPSDPEWNPHADIAEPYGFIDIFDIMEVVANYGKRWVFPHKANT